MSSKNLRTIPVYRKALYLCEISREIAAYVSYNKDLPKLCESNSHRDIIANSLITDAILIPKKIEQAERSKSYTSRMKNALFVGIMTRNILSYCNGLEMDGVREKEYLNLLRSEIKNFRKSFKAWRRSLRKGGEDIWGTDNAFGF